MKTIQTQCNVFVEQNNYYENVMGKFHRSVLYVDSTIPLPIAWIALS